VTEPFHKKKTSNPSDISIAICLGTVLSSACMWQCCVVPDASIALAGPFGGVRRNQCCFAVPSQIAQDVTQN